LRDSYVGDYYDAAGRLIAEADYGTTAVAAPAEPDPTVPSPSADVLLTTYGYDAAGNQNKRGERDRSDFRAQKRGRS